MHLDRQADLTGWIPLARCAELPAALVGRKARALAAASADGIVTPGGLVLSSAAFWDVLERCGVADRARYLADAALRLDPEHSLHVAATIEETLAAAPLEEIATSFAASAFTEIGVARRVCRSSAAMEDGLGAAFPGIFLSVLDIRSVAALASAIAACWRSVFRPTPLRYVLRLRLPQVDFSLALLVQPQVEAAWYGICFSENPVVDKGGMVAQLSDAAPDALMCGAPPRSQFVWQDGAWRGDRVAPAGLARLADAVTLLARRQAGPVDVEFALVEGQDDPVVLQCRPITPRAGAMAPLRPDEVLERIGGTPCAPGRVAGWAVQGDITLVPRVTTQDYALLLASRALVAAAETSPLGHVAILCRELGVPLVSGVGDAIDRLAGQRLLVDGGEGDVLVLPTDAEICRPQQIYEDEDDAVLCTTELLLRLCARAGQGDDPNLLVADTLADYRRRLGAVRHRIVAERDPSPDCIGLLASFFGKEAGTTSAMHFVERVTRAP